MNRHAAPLALVFSAILACPVHAQERVNLANFQRQLEQINRETRLLVDEDVPVDQRALVEYGGVVSFNFYSIDDTGQETHIFWQTNATGYARVNVDGVHEFFVRVRTTYDDWNSGDSFNNHGDDWTEPTLDRGIYKFDLQRYVSAYEGENIPFNLVVQGGRQLVHWANGLALSEQIDGGLITLSYKELSLEILAGATRDSIADFDSSRPDFNNDTQRVYTGGMLSYQIDPRHRPYVYGLVQIDRNPSELLSFGSIDTKFNYDSYYFGFGSDGSFGDNLVYGVEMVYEGGEGLSNSFDNTFSNIRQTEEDIDAFAMDVRLDYLFNDQNRTRLSTEFVLATGDSDRVNATNTFGGNKPGTKDHGFNSLGLINTGLAFAPAVSNLLMIRTGVSMFPLPDSDVFGRMQVGANFFVYNKFNRDAPIDEDSANQQVTPPTKDKTYLGSELDLFVNWQMTSDVTLALRYGVFFPGSSISTDHDARHFFFTGVAFAF